MSTTIANSLRSGPNERGRFGDYGGRFVADTLMPLILEVEKAYNLAKSDPAFHADLEYHLKHLILSHHGKLEYGSPKRPATLEAQLLHHIDDLDSKMNSISTFMKSEHSGARWTGYHRAYDQYYYKPDAYLFRNGEIPS